MTDINELSLDFPEITEDTIITERVKQDVCNTQYFFKVVITNDAAAQDPKELEELKDEIIDRIGSWYIDNAFKRVGVNAKVGGHLSFFDSETEMLAGAKEGAEFCGAYKNYTLGDYFSGNPEIYFGIDIFREKSMYSIRQIKSVLKDLPKVLELNNQFIVLHIWRSSHIPFNSTGPAGGWMTADDLKPLSHGQLKNRKI